MSWVIFALAAAVIWSIVNIFDKHILSQELKDPILATTATGSSLFLFFSVASLFFGSVYLPFSIIVPAFLAGMSYCIAILIYYTVMRKEEISRIMPIFSVIPIFVAILAYFLLGETFTKLTYLGIFFIVVGSVLISLRKVAHPLSAAFYVIVISSLFFAFRNILIKFATLENSIFSVMFWVGLGGFFVSFVLFVAHHPHIREKAKYGVEHLLIVGLFAAIAFFCFTLAISKGPVSLVAALVQTQPVFVFLGATFLSLFHPKFIHEKITKWILLQKTIAVILVIIGAYLITQ